MNTSHLHLLNKIAEIKKVLSPSKEQKQNLSEYITQAKQLGIYTEPSKDRIPKDDEHTETPYKTTKQIK